MREIKVERRGSYKGVSQYGITGCAEITPTRAVAEKWARLARAEKLSPDYTSLSAELDRACRGD